MKKVFVLFAVFTSIMLSSVTPQAQAAFNYGDFRSETLVTKAWGALKENNIEAVLAYTNKCIEMYSPQAKKMQESLTEFASGSNDKIFSYWALNDVATANFIQGEVYRKAGMNDEAKAAYKKVATEYSFGQAWDPQGWFWKPGDAAKEKLAMLESGSDVDFGDSSSSYLTTQAWKALANKPEDVSLYVNKVLELYAAKAQEMQGSLTDYADGKESIFSYWALNDVGTSLFVQGEAYKKLNKMDDAKQAYKRAVDEFSFAQCWDPQGWFWKPSEASLQALDSIEE